LPLGMNRKAAWETGQSASRRIVGWTNLTIVHPFETAKPA
jgi:hypothetical protein